MFNKGIKTNYRTELKKFNYLFYIVSSLLSPKTDEQ